jgi:outer membrane protein
MGSRRALVIPLSLVSLSLAPAALAQKSKRPPAKEPSALEQELERGPTVSLSLAEVVRLALEHSPDLATAAAAARGAEARYSKAKGARGPGLSVTGNINQFTEPLLICLAGPGACKSEGGDIDDAVIHDATTLTATAILSVPLTSQFSLGKQARAESYEVESAELAREVTKREVAWQAQQGYIQLLKARALKDAAAASVELAEAQLEKVKRYVQAGSLAKNDLLKAELSLSQSEQTLILAEAGVLIAEGALAVAAGLPPETHIQPTDSYSKDLPGIPVSLAEATKAARENRPELDQAQAQLKKSEALKDASKSYYFPAVNAVAVGTFTDGITFQDGPQAFAGLTASWSIFDWGVVRSQVAITDAEVGQSEGRKEKVEMVVVLDVRSRYLNLLGTQASLAVAEKAIESARENLRTTETRFEGRSATTTDLLDAQVLLTRAQVAEITARYDFYISLAGLHKAMGEPISDRYLASADR